MFNDYLEKIKNKLRKGQKCNMMKHFSIYWTYFYKNAYFIRFELVGGRVLGFSMCAAGMLREETVAVQERKEANNT